MPKTPKLKNEIYDYVLTYFEARYRENQTPKIKRQNHTEKKFPTIESIIDLVSESEKYWVSKSKEEVKSNPEEGQTSVSDATVRKAVEKLIEDGKITKQGDSYEYIPQAETTLKQFPILKIAKSIDVSVGDANELVVLSVPAEYAVSIANFLSALFYKGDVIFIPISDKILCISVFPKSELDRMSKLKDAAVQNSNSKDSPSAESEADPNQDLTTQSNPNQVSTTESDSDKSLSAETNPNETSTITNTENNNSSAEETSTTSSDPKDTGSSDPKDEGNPDDNTQDETNDESVSNDIECPSLHQRLYTSLLQFNTTFPDFTYGECYEQAFNMSYNLEVREEFLKKVYDIMAETKSSSKVKLSELVNVFIQVGQEMAEKEDPTA